MWRQELCAFLKQDEFHRNTLLGFVDLERKGFVVFPYEWNIPRSVSAPLGLGLMFSGMYCV